MTDFTILVLSGVYATSVAATLGILQVVSTLALCMKAPRLIWCVLSADTPSAQLGNGMQVEAAALPKCPRPDGGIWIVLGLGPDYVDMIATCLAQGDVQWAAHVPAVQVATGGQMAASCSAVFLLQTGGLLHGRCITTS